VGDRLVALVQRLRRVQRAPRRETEQRVRVPLERRQVVEQERLLALLLLLELGDRARLVAARIDDLRGLVFGLEPLAAQIAAGVVALLRAETGLDEPVGLGDERADLELAPDDQRERGRLNAAERHGAVERGAKPDRRR